MPRQIYKRFSFPFFLSLRDVSLIFIDIPKKRPKYIRVDLLSEFSRILSKIYIYTWKFFFLPCGTRLFLFAQDECLRILILKASRGAQSKQRLSARRERTRSRYEVKN